MRQPGFRAASWILRGGVIVSAALLILGLADALVAPDPVGSIEPGRLVEAVHGLASLRTGSMIHLGLLVLLVTPIARIVAVAIELAVRRETPFVLISAGVLFLLCASVWLSVR